MFFLAHPTYGRLRIVDSDAVGDLLPSTGTSFRPRSGSAASATDDARLRKLDVLELRLVQEETRTRFQKLGRRKAQTMMRPMSISMVLCHRMGHVLGGGKRWSWNFIRGDKREGRGGGGLGKSETRLTPRASPCIPSS